MRRHLARLLYRLADRVSTDPPRCAPDQSRKVLVHFSGNAVQDGQRIVDALVAYNRANGAIPNGEL